MVLPMLLRAVQINIHISQFFCNIHQSALLHISNFCKDFFVEGCGFIGNTVKEICNLNFLLD